MASPILQPAGRFINMVFLCATFQDVLLFHLIALINLIEICLKAIVTVQHNAPVQNPSFILGIFNGIQSEIVKYKKGWHFRHSLPSQ